MGKRRKKARKAASLCMFWALWRERNRRAFDNFESMDQICIYFGIELDCTLRADLYHC